MKRGQKTGAEQVVLWPAPMRWPKFEVSASSVA